MSTTKRYVDAFGLLMEAKLAENRHKGDRAGWLSLKFAALRAMLAEERAELDRELDAVERLASAPDTIAGAALRQCVARECADEANVLMFIADKLGALPFEDVPPDYQGSEHDG